MNTSEESVAFFHEIGLALSQWAYVENQLARVVSLCASPQDRNIIALGFLSIENFRSKLQFCDNLIANKFSSSAHLDYWKEITEKLRSASAKRNKVAHHISVLFSEGDVGRRFALVPWLDENMKPTKTSPAAPANGGRTKPPPNSLCVRNIASITGEFHQLTTALANLYDLLCGRLAPFPGSPAPIGSQPTIRWLRLQIREALELPPPPLRKKPSRTQKST